jgi:hypothetical protein
MTKLTLNFVKAQTRSSSSVMQKSSTENLIHHVLFSNLELDNSEPRVIKGDKWVIQLSS